MEGEDPNCLPYGYEPWQLELAVKEYLPKRRRGLPKRWVTTYDQNQVRIILTKMFGTKCLPSDTHEDVIKYNRIANANSKPVVISPLMNNI